VLVLNLSLPNAQVLIMQMELFKSIKTLIVTCNSGGAPVDLAQIIDKARGYPLQRLYITNFRGFVSTIPDLSRFKGLTVLALYGNDLRAVPPSVGTLNHLQSLYLDANPVGSVAETVKTLSQLTELGITKTGVSAEERRRIQQLLPDCKLL
jgi:Leucine-rich repeat (LRR) protein